MNISNTTDVQATLTSTPSGSSVADDAALLVLKKSMDVQAQGALTLLQLLPQPALASEGPIGTRINTFA